MKQKKLPMRMCLGCREMKDKRELARIVRNADGTVSYDTTGRAPGRGAYICRDAACLDKAVKTNAVFRSLEVNITPEEISRIREVLEADGN